jgi:hypothetical protein
MLSSCDLFIINDEWRLFLPKNCQVPVVCSRQCHTFKFFSVASECKPEEILKRCQKIWYVCSLPPDVFVVCRQGEDEVVGESARGCWHEHYYKFWIQKLELFLSNVLSPLDRLPTFRRASPVVGLPLTPLDRLVGATLVWSLPSFPVPT